MLRYVKRVIDRFGVADVVRSVQARRSVELQHSLTGQVALVTGATRGLGAEIADQLNALDATVYAGARETDDVDNTALRPVQLDVTEPADIEAAAERIAAEAGRLDVLVNNAGVFGPTGRLATLDRDAIDDTLAVNLRGPIAVSRQFLPLLTEQAGARIINVSSRSGQFTGGTDDESLPYSVSKAGLNAFTDALASQYPELVVNAACPGPTRTDMVGPSAPRSVQEGATTPVWLARFSPESPTGLLWKDQQPIGW